MLQLLDRLEEVYRPFHTVLKRRDSAFTSAPLMSVSNRNKCRLVLDEVNAEPTTTNE